MISKLFTKSAFKQALQCPASLYYYYDSEHYANQDNEDSFLIALAEGGQQVGDLAKVYYKVPDDCDIQERGYEAPLKRTAELFQRENATIAEAAFRWENCFVRADIVQKRGKQIDLIEVKATSWNPEVDSFMQKRKKNDIERNIFPYVYDVAFQKYIIQNALGPEYTVTAYLMMADKRVAAPADGMNLMFQVIDANGRASIRRSPDADGLASLDHILTPFPVDELCDRIIAGQTGEQEKVLSGMHFKDFVAEISRQYVRHERHFVEVGGQCLTCSFRSDKESPKKLDGKRECWTEKANFTEADFLRPSTADLWSGKAGGKNARDVTVKSPKGYLFDNGIFFMEDVTPGDLPASKSKDIPGLLPADRRLLQIGLTTGKEELLSDFSQNIHDGVYLDIPGLKAEMSAWRYPLHMIDFETTAVALPFYMGMRPYEQVAFQFSHHIIETDGSICHAGQYLNTQKRHFPNFEFVRELKRQLEGDNGTVFRYATHENTILRAIRKQLIASSEQDKEELIGFVDTITRATDAERKAGNSHTGSRDMVDLLDIILRYYYHPSMKGSNSIKAVLPAILNSSKAIQKKYQEPIYGDTIPSQNYKNGNTKAWINFNPDSTVKNPYKLLDSVASYLGVTDDELEQFDATYVQEGEQIANGGAALAAYSKLQFASETETKALAEALLRYCELDTMSMVFIWEYFHEMTAAD